MTNRKARRIVKDGVEDARSLMHQHQIPAGDAIDKIMGDMTPDVMAEVMRAQLMDDLGRTIRKYALEATFAPQQMILMGMERSVPPYIVVENNGNPYELEQQDATPEQIAGHYELVDEQLKRKQGIVSRELTFWRDYDGPHDVPVGQQSFKDITCAICGLPWRLGDPFQRAHDVPVAAATGDTAWQWAHRSCNNAEGTGGRVYALDS